VPPSARVGPHRNRSGGGRARAAGASDARGGRSTRPPRFDASGSAWTFLPTYSLQQLDRPLDEGRHRNFPPPGLAVPPNVQRCGGLEVSRSWSTARIRSSLVTVTLQITHTVEARESRLLQAVITTTEGPRRRPSTRRGAAELGSRVAYPFRPGQRDLTKGGRHEGESDEAMTQPRRTSRSKIAGERDYLLHRLANVERLGRELIEGYITPEQNPVHRGRRHPAGLDRLIAFADDELEQMWEDAERLGWSSPRSE
jgi:hypothetical protein